MFMDYCRMVMQGASGRHDSTGSPRGSLRQLWAKARSFWLDFSFVTFLCSDGKEKLIQIGA
jgi:hypothetical protein